MFLWCRLPDGIDAAEIAREALAADIVLAPGNVFSLSQSAHGFLRFNVAQSLDGRLFDVLQTAILRRERSRHQSLDSGLREKHEFERVGRDAPGGGPPHARVSSAPFPAREETIR